MPKAKYDPLSQFRAPLNYELAGKDFHIILDDGNEIFVRFIDGENLQWSETKGPYIWEKYECLKADDNTYFVHINTAAGEGKLNYCLILDLLQDLVTFIKLEEGKIEESDRLILVTPVFGAIKIQGRALPKNRHHFTDRMVGRRIVWQYSSGFNKMHIYYKPTLYRLPRVDSDSFRRRYEAETDPEEKARLKGYVDRFDRTEEAYPFAEEPCFHITINEHMNLFCFVEENETLCDPLKAIGGGGIVLLQDLDRLVQNGLGFGKGSYAFCTGYGREVFEPDEVEFEEVPYDETKLKTIPCIYDIKFGE
ncbi:MAG: MoaF N-terminal domain-containing protein [Lachnospiraceae bacterium]|nr:MoaF N-terminal domain-containing protein [Lachnospiraceae bacterium]